MSLEEFLSHMRQKAESVDTPRVRPLAISMFLTGSSMGVIAPGESRITAILFVIKITYDVE